MGFLSLLPATWWLKPALIGVAVLALMGGLWRFHHVAYESGFADSSRESAAKIADMQNRAAQAVTEANAKALIAERKATAKIDEVSTTYEKELTDANDKHAALVASITRGTGRLRVDLAPVASRSGVPQVAADPASVAGTGTGELSTVASEGLIALETRADKVAMKLKWCVQLAQIDREEINGEPAK